VIQATFDAKQGVISEEERDETIETVNEEIKGIIECGKILNHLKKGD
jgi:hypothetical protein